MWDNANIKTLAVTNLVGIAHIVCGLTVLHVPGAIEVTQLNGIYDLVGNATTGAYLLILVGVLAIIARSFSFVTCVALLVPQQFLLLLQIWSISVVLTTGVFPDGHMPIGGSWFILTDQIWPWLLTVSHSVWLSIFIYQGLRGYGDSNNKTLR
jgi:hypothetical protein